MNSIIEREAEVELCRRDKAYHIGNHFFIKDTGGVVRPLRPLRRGQKKLASILYYCRKVWKIPARVLVYKSRKIGMSSYVLADMFTEVLEHGYDGIIIAHVNSASHYLLSILKRYYKLYDLDKPGLKKDSRRELEFDGREGMIEVLTAKNVDSSRSRTPQYIHSSEGAYWHKGWESAAALFQSLPKNANTTHVFETTANGEDPLFKGLWDAAFENCQLHFDEPRPGEFIPRLNVKNEERWNGFIPLFISSIEDEQCRLPLGEDEKVHVTQTMDQYEMNLHRRLQAPVEYIKWRRKKIAELGGNLKVFNQEYCPTEDEGFIISGHLRFDMEKLNSMPLEEGTIGYLKQEEAWDRRISFVPDRNEFLTVFRRPIRGHNYVIGIDVASGTPKEGTKDTDQTVAVVIDIDEGGVAAQVATYANRITEEHVVGPIKMLGDWYNNAYLVPELGGGHGTHLVEELRKIYPIERIYHRRDQSGQQVGGHILGWRTHLGNRALLIGGLASALVDNMLFLRDRETAREFKAFKYGKRGIAEAAFGHHDDHVIAAALCVKGMETFPMKDLNRDAPPPPWEIKRLYTPTLAESDEGRNTVTGY